MSNITNGNLPSGDIEDMTKFIKDRKDFCVFLERLLENHSSNTSEWENTSLRDFLTGMAGFSSHMEGYYANMKIAIDCEKPSWRVFADILLAARVYE